MSETQGTSRAGLAVRELFSFTLFQTHVEYRHVLAVLYAGLDLPTLPWVTLYRKSRCTSTEVCLVFDGQVRLSEKRLQSGAALYLIEVYIGQIAAEFCLFCSVFGLSPVFLAGQSV